jgi:hypothetical protein
MIIKFINLTINFTSAFSYFFLFSTIKLKFHDENPNIIIDES